MDKSHSNFFNTPPRVAQVIQITSTILEPQRFNKLAEFRLHKRFGEYICWVLSVGMYLTAIFPFSTASRMKWYHILMCLVWAWNLLSFDYVIAPWLSQLSVTGLLNPRISWTNVCKYIASFTAWVCAMYSASVLDNATIYCFFELQVMVPISMWNEYPEIECLCSCPAQPASQNHSRIVFPCPLNVSQRVLVLPRYKISLFTPSQCTWPRFWMIWDRIPIVNTTSGLKIPTVQRTLLIVCAYGTSCIWNSCVEVDRLWSLLNVIPGSIGVLTHFALVNLKILTILSI